MGEVDERQRLACRTCGLVLNPLRHPDGTLELLHSRTWEEHDHEPDPVLASQVVTTVICDFCAVGEPLWLYHCEEISLAVVAGDDDVRQRNVYGDKYSACEACDKLIRRGDPQQLVEHIMATSPDKAGFRDWDSREQREEFRAHLLRMQSLVLSTIKFREPVPPPAPPLRPIQAAQMPRIRDRLMRYWGDESVRKQFEFTGEGGQVAFPGADCGQPERPAVRSRPNVRVPQEVIDAFCERKRRGVAVAQLYWISEQFTSLAISAGKKLPDVTLTVEELPAKQGLLVWDQPVVEVAGPSARIALVIAASWTLIPQGIWITLYSRPEQVMPELPTELARERIGWLLPVAPGGAIPFGRNLVPESERAGTIVKTLLATWFLMAQPGVAAVAEQEADKNYRRSYARKHKSNPSPVKLVDLRKQPARSGGVEDDGKTFSYSVRFVVGAATGGFWRDQPHGPGRSLRKRVWIAPYMKGPDGAPLKTGMEVQTVKVLR